MNDANIVKIICYVSDNKLLWICKIHTQTHIWNKNKNIKKKIFILELKFVVAYDLWHTNWCCFFWTW